LASLLIFAAALPAAAGGSNTFSKRRNEISSAHGPVAPLACATSVFLYVALWSPATLVTYCINADGSLTFESTQPAAADARDLLVHPSRTRLYYAHTNLDEYAIPVAGTPVLTGTVPVGSGAFDDLDIDPSASTLYGTHSNGTLRVFNISGVGLPVPQQTVSGLYGPHGVAVAPDDTAIFVANQWSFLGDPADDQEIVGFVLNKNGTVNTAQKNHSKHLARPEYLVLHPTLPIIYHTDRPGGALAAVQVGGATFTQTDNLFSGFGSSRLVRNAAGNRIYVANTDEFSVSVFAVNGTDLALLEEEPAGVGPIDLVLHPDATFLYTVDGGLFGGPSQIWTLAVQGDGTLTPVGAPTPLPLLGYRLAVVRTGP
jgi:DNA-binding beta-propeller fold protein YncE